MSNFSKICNKCKLEKPLEEFNNNKRVKDGKRSMCKICHRTWNKNWNKKNPNYQKNWNKEHKEYFRLYREEWVKNNPNKLKIINDRFEKNNPNYKENWNKENQGYSNTYTKNRCKKDKDFKTIRILRGSFYKHVLKKDKKKSSFKLLGCPLEQFYAWIESRFLLGMSWDNYGKWEYDHIIPCNHFKSILKNINILEGQQMCFHYTNIQPMWKTENIKKNDILPEDYNRRVWKGSTIGWVVE